RVGRPESVCCLRLSVAFMAYVDDGRDRAILSRRDGRRESAAPASLPNLHLHISRAVARRRSAFPELDCMRNRLPPAVLDAVEQRAVEAGVSADRVLIAWGVISEDSYMMALARWLGLDF